MNWVYLFVPPQGVAIKYGITGSIRGRLGKYQLPYGPTWEAAYHWVSSHPDPKVISWLEDSIEGHFRFHRWGLGPGMTEWLQGVTATEIRDYVMMVNADLNLGLQEHGYGPWNPTRLVDTFTEDMLKGDEDSRFAP